VEVHLHRAQEDRERVVENPPRDGLADREAGDDDPAVIEARAYRYTAFISGSG
jgi:hypothetical protein